MSAQLATAPSASNQPDHHEHHVTPAMVYVKSYFVLLFFMVLTIVASRYDLGAMNNVVAMAIAITKAVIVVLFFMQVKNGSKLVWLWASLGFIWLFLLFGIMGDYQTRDWVRSSGWENPAPESNTIPTEK